jgi:hypothetical protein
MGVLRRPNNPTSSFVHGDSQRTTKASSIMQPDFDFYVYIHRYYAKVFSKSVSEKKEWLFWDFRGNGKIWE